jgi:hypothetical protein
MIRGIRNFLKVLDFVLLQVFKSSIGNDHLLLRLERPDRAGEVCLDDTKKGLRNGKKIRKSIVYSNFPRQESFRRILVIIFGSATHIFLWRKFHFDIQNDLGLCSNRQKAMPYLSSLSVFMALRSDKFP